MATAVMALKSSPAIAKRLRAWTPYSSTVRARSVVSRQCQAKRSPSNTPSDVFVLPTSITSNMPVYPLKTFSIAQDFFYRVGRGDGAVLRPDLPARLGRARSVTLVAEQRAQFSRGRGGVVLRAREDAARADAADAGAVVELVVAERDYQRGDARAQALRRRADAALMDDRARARQHLAVGRVVERGDALGQRLRMILALADEQQRARPDGARRLDGLLIKVSRDVDGRRAEREDDGRLARVEKPEQLGVYAPRVARAVAPVVEGEARDAQLRRPVGLPRRDDRREEPEREPRRVL